MILMQAFCNTCSGFYMEKAALEGLQTKDEVSLTPLGTSPVFQCLKNDARFVRFLKRSFSDLSLI